MALVGGITGSLRDEHVQGFLRCILFGVVDIIAVIPELGRVLSPLNQDDAGPSCATTSTFGINVKYGLLQLLSPAVFFELLLPTGPNIAIIRRRDVLNWHPESRYSCQRSVELTLCSSREIKP